MKQMLKKATLLIAIFAISVAVTGCKKDNNDKPREGDGASIIAGTFKGTLEVFGGEKHYDAIIIISRISDNKIRITAKSGEDYSNITTKEVNVMHETVSNSVFSVPADPEATLAYSGNDRTLTLLTKDTHENDVVYNFNGKKE